MTKDELKLAFQKAFLMGQDYWYYANHEFEGYNKKSDAIRAKFNEMVKETIEKSLAQPEQDNTYIYASSLATAIWQKHYMKESPKFALLDTTEGVLTQIDNMTCGLVREKPAQPEKYPQIAISPEIVGYVAPQRTWVDLSDEDIWEAYMESPVELDCSTDELYALSRTVEAKLKEKNTLLKNNRRK